MIGWYAITEIVVMLLIMFVCLVTAIMISVFFIYITLDLIYKIKDDIIERRDKNG